MNLLLSVLSAWYLTVTGFDGPHVGLAAATSAAALLNAALLYRGLRRDGVLRQSPGWPTLLARVMAANIVMCGALFWLHRPVSWWLDVTILDRVVWLAVSVTAGAGAYFLVLLMLGMRLSQFRLKAI